VAVNVVDSPGVTITTPDSLICVNGVSTISSTIDIAGTYTYQWQTSPNGTTGWANISGQTNSAFTNSFLVAGSYFYRVIVSGSAQCNDGTSNAFQIRVVSSPTATVVAPSNITCIGTQATLSASVSNGAGSITYHLHHLIMLRVLFISGLLPPCLQLVVLTQFHQAIHLWW
jgi:hypothetical protein